MHFAFKPSYSVRAKYFVGTIYILRGEYVDALAAFRAVLDLDPANDAEARAVELTYLALARLYYETDQLEQSVDAYRAVPQTSDQFDIAQYELAWTYIAKGDAVQAERALSSQRHQSGSLPWRSDRRRC